MKIHHRRLHWDLTFCLKALSFVPQTKRILISTCLFCKMSDYFLCFDFLLSQLTLLLKSKPLWRVGKSCHLISKGPSINDVSPNFRFLGYPPSPCLLKSTSIRLLFGHFLYPPPSPFGETSFIVWLNIKSFISEMCKVKYANKYFLQSEIVS